MEDCNKDIIAGILYSCKDRPKKGIENFRAVIINRSDIDFAASTIVGSQITYLALKVGKKGYPLEWTSSLGNATSTFVPNDAGLPGYTHNFNTIIPTQTAINLNTQRDMTDGLFVIAFESKYKGLDNSEAFNVMGWDNAMKLTTGELDFNANSGMSTISFTSPTDEIEQFAVNKLNETDYDTTLARFNAFFEATAEVIESIAVKTSKK